jgi:hypothetical protein
MVIKILKYKKVKKKVFNKRRKFLKMDIYFLSIFIYIDPFMFFNPKTIFSTFSYHKGF